MKKALVLLVILFLLNGCRTAEKSVEFIAPAEQTEASFSPLPSPIATASIETAPPSTPELLNEKTPEPSEEPVVSPEPKTFDILISKENWEEYFELYQREEWEKNAFGGNEGFTIYTAFKLKDKYASQIVDVFDGAANHFDILIVYSFDNYAVNVDYDAQTYTKKNNNSLRHVENREYVDSFYLDAMTSNVDFFCTSYEEGRDMPISYYSEMRVENIQGVLRLEDDVDN